MLQCAHGELMVVKWPGESLLVVDVSGVGVTRHPEREPPQLDPAQHNFSCLLEFSLSITFANLTASHLFFFFFFFFLFFVLVEQNCWSYQGENLASKR